MLDIAKLKSQSPTTEDQRKIHAEVNQLSGQAMNVTLSAVALFGGFCASILLRDQSQSPNVPSVICVAAVLLLIVLITLFYLTYTYFRSLRFLTTYLRITECSVWEAHYFQYTKENQRPFFFYSEARAILFAILGTITAALPLVLKLVTGKNFESLPLAIIMLPAWVAFVATVLYLGFKRDIHLGPTQSKSWEQFFGTARSTRP